MPRCHPRVEPASRRSPPDAGYVSARTFGRRPRGPVPAERVGGCAGLPSVVEPELALRRVPRRRERRRRARQPERREHRARYGGVHPGSRPAGRARTPDACRIGTIARGPRGRGPRSRPRRATRSPRTRRADARHRARSACRSRASATSPPPRPSAVRARRCRDAMQLIAELP